MSSYYKLNQINITNNNYEIKDELLKLKMRQNF